MNTSNDIIEEPVNKGAKNPTNKDAKNPTNKGAKNPTNKATKNPTNKAAKNQANKGAKKEPTNKAAKNQANKGAKKEPTNTTICNLMEASTIVCPEGVIDGRLFTKEKRQELYGRVAGGGGSTKPEKYQREQITLGTGRVCNTTQTRINWRKNEMKEISHPMLKEDGFDYTENFDGKQEFSSNTVWVNLKSVVGTGGSQTRTLRDECYPFVNAQLLYLVKSNSSNCFFANIFDGDEAASKMKMFHYLLGLPEFSDVKKYVYVGDLKGYFAWVSANM
jgi:hypothetical protein